MNDDDIESPWNRYYEDYINGAYVPATSTSTSTKISTSYGPTAAPYELSTEPDFELPDEKTCTDYIFNVGRTYSMFCPLCSGPMTVRMVSAAYDVLKRCKEVILARLDSQCDCPLTICVRDKEIGDHF